MLLDQQYKLIQKEDLRYPQHKHYLHQLFRLVYNKLYKNLQKLLDHIALKPNNQFFLNHNYDILVLPYLQENTRFVLILPDGKNTHYKDNKG